MTPNDFVNVLALQHFLRIFDSENSYQLLSGIDAGGRKDLQEQPIGRKLFGTETTYSKLARMCRNGSVFKATKLSKEFNYEAFQSMNPDAVLLFVILENGELIPLSADQPLNPSPGHTVICLVTEQETEENNL